ncbi:DUF4386 family protein [Alkalicaulis satelles]|nr:DUF4386 family protein [Alkalicaulis satelles]
MTESPTETRAASRPLIGTGLIALAAGFNLAYAGLVWAYEYPAILRRPAAEALALYAQGGAGLTALWHAFALSAFLLIPAACAISLERGHLVRQPGLAVSAAITGALAGAVQAAALWRWVFALPPMTGADADPLQAAFAFDLLNHYAGAGLGEHMGQLLTALFLVQCAALQAGARARVLAVLAALSAALIALGTGESLSLALGLADPGFSLATIAGFAGFSFWLAGAGLRALTGPRVPPAA